MEQLPSGGVGIFLRRFSYLREITPGIQALRLRPFFERSILLQAKLVLRQKTAR